MGNYRLVAGRDGFLVPVPMTAAETRAWYRSIRRRNRIRRVIRFFKGLLHG